MPQIEVTRRSARPLTAASKTILSDAAAKGSTVRLSAQALSGQLSARTSAQKPAFYRRSSTFIGGHYGFRDLTSALQKI
jgi:hypothetical protein